MSVRGVWQGVLDIPAPGRRLLEKMTARRGRIKTPGVTDRFLQFETGRRTMVDMVKMVEVALTIRLSPDDKIIGDIKDRHVRAPVGRPGPGPGPGRRRPEK
jgi:hypothetical protein